MPVRYLGVYDMRGIFPGRNWCKPGGIPSLDVNHGGIILEAQDSQRLATKNILNE